VDLVAAEKDRERLEGEREQITAELEAGALEAGGLAGEDGAVAGELAALDQRGTGAAAAVAERRARLGERQGALAEWRGRHTEAEHQRTEAAARAAAREERARLDVTLTERRLALEHVATQLAERYGLGPEALADVPPADDGRDDERAARVEALRARLARLGDVNPAALTELEELRGRDEFLVGQRTDLERSLDDLRRTITKLIRTSRRR